jgi:hypothetical protein
MLHCPWFIVGGGSGESEVQGLQTCGTASGFRIDAVPAICGRLTTCNIKKPRNQVSMFLDRGGLADMLQNEYTQKMEFQNNTWSNPLREANFFSSLLQ